MSNEYFDDLSSRFNPSSWTGAEYCQAHHVLTESPGVELVGQAGREGHHQSRRQPENTAASAGLGEGYDLALSCHEDDLDLIMELLRLNAWSELGNLVDRELFEVFHDALLPLEDQASIRLTLKLDEILTSPDARRKTMVLLQGLGQTQGRLDWVVWFHMRFSLLPDESIFLSMHFGRILRLDEARKALRYVVAWHAAMKAESGVVERENAGEYAANKTLPPLKNERKEVMRIIRLRSRYGKGIANLNCYFG